MLDALLAAAVIWLEHSQSTVLACLIAVEVSNRVGGSIDKTSVAMTTFALAQILCYALALAIVIVSNQASLGLLLLLFLLLRELMISAIWRMILAGANEDIGYLPTRAVPRANPRRN